MKYNNICKFIIPAQQKTFSVYCFVLETDPNVMRCPSLLKSNRVMLVSKGEGFFHFDETKIPFSSGSLVFGFKEETFWAEFESECEYLYIHFEGNRADELFRRFHIRKSNRYFSNFDGLVPLWRDSLSRADQQTVDLASESILLYTFSRLTGSSVRRDSPVNKLIELLETRFNDPEVSIASISKELCYNPKYISHLFKEQMGVGITEYLRTLRIKYAVSLFEHGIDSVKNVALLSGFTDPLYFSTVFKKIVGVSPKEYINCLPNGSNPSTIPLKDEKTGT